MRRQSRPPPVVPPTELDDLHGPKAANSPELPDSTVTTPTTEDFTASTPPDTVNQSTEHLASVPHGDDATVYPGPLPLAILITGISLTAFLVALDRTIVATGKFIS